MRNEQTRPGQDGGGDPVQGPGPAGPGAQPRVSAGEADGAAVAAQPRAGILSQGPVPPPVDRAAVRAAAGAGGVRGRRPAARGLRRRLSRGGRDGAGSAPAAVLQHQSWGVRAGAQEASCHRLVPDFGPSRRQCRGRTAAQAKALSRGRRRSHWLECGVVYGSAASVATQAEESCDGKLWHGSPTVEHDAFGLCGSGCWRCRWEGAAGWEQAEGDGNVCTATCLSSPPYRRGMPPEAPGRGRWKSAAAIWQSPPSRALPRTISVGSEDILRWRWH